MERKKPASAEQKRVNRSTTHIRVKWREKFALEAFARKHRCKSINEAIRKLLGERNVE
ncbi:MAG: hypothetical protein QXG08_07135 [Candidatus Methanomethyliaceae archaeon]